MSTLKVNELDTESGTTITVASGKKIAGTASQFKMTDVVQGDVLYGSAADTLSRLAPGTSGQVLQTQGAGANPVWAAEGELPTQTSNAGKYLVTDGTTASWDRESPNILINGDFDVWQRGTTFNLSSATNIYTADRWRFEGNNFTGSLIRYGFTSGQTDVPDGPGYYARWINDTSANAQQYTQRIETTPPHKLSGQTVMMSVWLKSASGTIADGNLTWVGGGGNIGAITTTWTKFTKTWAIGTLSGSYYTVGFQVPATETLLGGVDIAHVQLEFGSVATTFKSLTFAQELQACKRYFQIPYNWWAHSDGGTATSWKFFHTFPVEMRAAPTLAAVGTPTVNQMNANAAGPNSITTPGTANKNGFQLSYTTMATGSGSAALANYPYQGFGGFTADAEL